MTGTGHAGPIRPFRFGVIAMPTPMSNGRELQQTARAAADRGYTSLLAPDNMFLLAPLPSLAVAAFGADIRVGTIVLSSPLRPPAVAAWEAHTMSVITDGRFELGIGAGMPMPGPLLEQSGIEFEDPARRVQRVEEIVERLKVLSAGNPVPVMVAAGGPATRRLAGRVADTVILTGDPYANVASRSGLVNNFRESAGERADDVELLSNLLIVGNGPVDAGVLRARGLDADQLVAADAVSVLRGTVSEMCDELQRRRELLGSSYITVSEPMLDAFAPVVETLAGQ